VLLLHGFGDTPQTLAELARYIHSAGYGVSVPLYPGHGTSVEDFFSSHAEDWVQAARDAFVELRASCDSVSVVGLSMGAAIGAVLAGESREVSSLVLLSPYLRIPLWIRAALKARRLWSPFIGEIDARHPDSIQDPAARERSLAYGFVNARVMSELARMVKMGWSALPAVKAPTLIIQSRNDPRVSGGTASAVERRLGSREKALEWTDAGGHVITVDYGREDVFAKTLNWISRWSGRPRQQVTRPPV
jgi:carboxylesterase